jgi:hypothetical protein
MYLGILNADRREPSEGSGYHRIDLSRHSFKISPGMTASEAMTFINTTTIAFPRTVKSYGWVHWFAVFDDIDSARPSMLIPMGRCVFVAAGVTASLAPGQLQLAVHCDQELVE